MGGKRIVLAASDSESSEFMKSTWRQMLLATLPARFGHFISRVSVKNDVRPDGQAMYVPQGLRVVEALLLQRFSPDEIAVCYPDQLGQFVGDETRVVGIHAHNPLGITFATDVYAQLYGPDVEPINAREFRRLITHPALRRPGAPLRIIVGGPGAWQIEHKRLQDAWGIDCLVNGEAEDVIVELFEKALRGDSLPRKVECHSPKLDSIPRIRHRSTFGAVEITRGCGRGCQFCSVALRAGKSIPLDHILDNVRVQVAEGADTILLVTEDVFLYEQGPKFETNVPALKRLFEAVAAVPGVEHVLLTHGTMAPLVKEPGVLEALSPVAVGKSLHTHPASSHPQKRFACLFIGIETGSVRLFKQHMKGKGYPYRPEQWPDVVLRGMQHLNQHNWFPFCTWIVGLPGEQPEDTKASLDLLFALKDARWIVVPTLFVPLEDTRLEKKGARSAKIVELTDLQWEFFFTCWRYNLDFYHRRPMTMAKFALGIPLYYYSLGRKYFGSQMLYPLLRLGWYPEWLLRRKLYLDFSGRMKARYTAPPAVLVPDHSLRPAMPDLVTLPGAATQAAD